jgi:hypothetical protein
MPGLARMGRRQRPIPGMPGWQAAKKAVCVSPAHCIPFSIFDLSNFDLRSLFDEAVARMTPKLQPSLKIFVLRRRKHASDEACRPVPGEIVPLHEDDLRPSTFNLQSTTEPGQGKNNFEAR